MQRSPISRKRINSTMIYIKKKAFNEDSNILKGMFRVSAKLYAKIRKLRKSTVQRTHETNLMSDPRNSLLPLLVANRHDWCELFIFPSANSKETMNLNLLIRKRRMNRRIPE